MGVFRVYSVGRFLMLIQIIVGGKYLRSLMTDGIQLPRRRWMQVRRAREVHGSRVCISFFQASSG